MVGGDPVVHPDFTALVVCGDDIGRAQYLHNISVRHADTNLTLYGPDRKRLPRGGRLCVYQMLTGGLTSHQYECSKWR